MTVGRYKAYSEYRGYRSVYLTEIPSEWVVKPLQRLCDFRQGKAHEPFVDDEGKFICVNARFVSTQGMSMKRCTTNLTPANLFDVLMVMSDLPNGRALARAFFVNDNKKYAVNQRICAITARKVDAKFLYYQLDRSPYFLMYDDGSNQTHLSNNAYKKYPVLLPSFEEQKQIANFLDHETAKIDTLIEKQQQLIKLLKEKRQAVISHAVTKGLNPDAPMKDSGVEWLGEVPRHWTVAKAKFISRIFIPQRNKPELNDTHGVSWATMEDMGDQYIESTRHHIDGEAAKLAGSKMLKAGAVIASCVGNFGVASINRIDVIINQQLQAFIPSSIKAEYLRGIITISKTYFELIGTAATLVYVNQQGFENLPVLLPPMNEQENICVHVEMKCGKFDKLIVQCNKTLKLLQERRTAIISAAVTGKIDVRNWQSSVQNQTNKEDTI